MSNETTYRAFFGDMEHDFRLTPVMVLELERVTGAGIGGLFNRMVRNEFKSREIVETIRLGLIGAGTPPETAAALVNTYVEHRPIFEGYALAVEILNAAMFGQSRNVEAAMMAEETVMGTTLSGGDQ
jgi:hypothetical protein